jgi:hypothetical protein
MRHERWTRTPDHVAWRLLGGMFGVQPDAPWAAMVMTD